MHRWIETTSALLCAVNLGCGPGRPDGWDDESHGSGVAADYERLFPVEPSEVHRFDITIAAADCAAATADLEDKLSGGGPGATVTEDPIFVPVTLELDGQTWWHVGMRYKGNSSLRSAYQSGIEKLAFRLNFEMYEDDFPEIDNQRFYGFKKMTFSNGFKDPSLIRDRLAAEIFRNGGVPVARTAFASVYVDCGEGETYFGLYTMIEDPSDEMLESQFSDGSGNLYKPEDEGATWVEPLDTADFYKKTNLDSDWSDVIATHEALHADHDASEWRSDLEARFDVDGFLRLLALNQVMVNWDSYGCMPHNYYLYADPANGGRLSWFPWDLNESLLVESRNRCGTVSSSIMLEEVGSDWPMIRRLLDDPEYRQRYEDEVRSAIEGAFEPTSVQAMIEAYHELVSPYVVGPKAVEVAPYTFLGSAEAFEDSVDGSQGLKLHVEARQSAARQALGI